MLIEGLIYDLDDLGGSSYVAFFTLHEKAHSDLGLFFVHAMACRMNVITC